MIRTDRLHIFPASREQMAAMIASEQDTELKKAYAEMLEGCLRHPDRCGGRNKMNNEEMNGSLAVNEKVYRIVRLLGKGKGGYSYLAERDGRQAVIKQIHHEPCDYYTFGNKIEAELRDYGRLQKAGIRIPGMHAVDKDNERIVKDYIEGLTVMELIRSGASVEPYLPYVRDMAAKATAAGLNIDYYPTNFVVQDGLLWYVDYECNDYSEQWDFEHWGIQYWQSKVSFRSYRDEDYEAVCDF